MITVSFLIPILRRMPLCLTQFKVHSVRTNKINLGNAPNEILSLRGSLFILMCWESEICSKETFYWVWAFLKFIWPQKYSSLIWKFTSVMTVKIILIWSYFFQYFVHPYLSFCHVDHGLVLLLFFSNNLEDCHSFFISTNDCT